eukprot:3146789-Pleurochrysis_carterae.AAC.2
MVKAAVCSDFALMNIRFESALFSFISMGDIGERAAPVSFVQQSRRIDHSAKWRRQLKVAAERGMEEVLAARRFSLDYSD